MTSPPYSNADLAQCAEREVKQRERVYARLVYMGRMKAHDAEVQIAMMREIAQRMRNLANADAIEERLL